MQTGSAPRVSGYAYVYLLVTIALLGWATADTMALGATLARRDAERQLLAVGHEYQAALRSYAGVAQHTTTGVQAHGPQTLDDLLRDPRTPGVRRHLRRIYADPLTGKADWGTVRNPQGQIVGIYSLAPGVPIQRTGFEHITWAGFDNADSYGQWVFGLPGTVPGKGPSSLPRGTATAP